MLYTLEHLHNKIIQSVQSAPHLSLSLSLSLFLSIVLFFYTQKLTQRDV